MVSWESKWCGGSLSRERERGEREIGKVVEVEVVEGCRFSAWKKEGKMTRQERVAEFRQFAASGLYAWRWMGSGLIWRSLHQIIDASVPTHRRTAAAGPVNRWSQLQQTPLKHDCIGLYSCRVEASDELVCFYYCLLFLPVRGEQGEFAVRIYAELADNFQLTCELYFLSFRAHCWSALMNIEHQLCFSHSTYLHTQVSSARCSFAFGVINVILNKVVIVCNLFCTKNTLREVLYTCILENALKRSHLFSVIHLFATGGRAATWHKP